MAKRMSRRLVGLSAAAVAAVYGLGLRTTTGSVASLRAGAAPASTSTGTLAQTSLVSQAPGPATATPGPGSSATSVSAATATATPTGVASAGSRYRDGTYSGQGDSRRGGFAVAVTIQGGQIASVAITQAWTQYPAARVAALPAEVVARQSAAVDNVTGATYSAQAFKQAVGAALAQASRGTVL